MSFTNPQTAKSGLQVRVTWILFLLIFVLLIWLRFVQRIPENTCLDQEEIPLAASHTEPTGVTVLTQEKQGAGCICAVSRNALIVGTAAHVVSDTVSDTPETEVSIAFSQGSKIKGQVVFCSKEKDLAFVRVSLRTLPRSLQTSLRRVHFPGEEDALLTDGQRIYVHTGKGMTNSGFVADVSVQRQDTGSPVMRCYLDAQPGFSGSGVFDGRGFFRGILSMSSDDGQILVVPEDVILESLLQLIHK